MLQLPERIDETVAKLFRMAAIALPKDVIWALEAATAWETNEVARTQLATVLDNVSKAEFLGVPMCQDTGLPVVFVKGRLEADMEALIRKGVARATREVPLRPNVVHPLTRENGGDNLGVGMPHIHWTPGPEEYTEITVMPKGAGSENMTALAMLRPGDGLKGIKEFVLRTVVEAGGKPCPPTIVGLGIGGTADQCLSLAKEALLVPLDRRNPDTELRKLEEALFEALNMTGIGPMGLGGDTTVLGVRAKMASCHTASLPVAVNLQCWAARRATARVWENGKVAYSMEGFE
jgi:fumarate hydratase subunit alpha